MMMKGFTAVVTDPVGMHSRPAVVVVNAANCFQSQILIKYNGKQADVKSIMNLISLGIPTHVEIEVECVGEDEELACETIRKTLIHEGIIEVAKDRITSAGIDNTFKKEVL